MRKRILKNNQTPAKINKYVYFCVAYSSYFSTSINRVNKWIQISFNLSWLRVQISYHRIINFAELLNGDLAAKIGRGIFSKDLNDRKCNFSLTYKDNRKCVSEDKYQSRCIIYKVKCSICDGIYIRNTQQTFKK